MNSAPFIHPVFILDCDYLRLYKLLVSHESLQGRSHVSRKLAFHRAYIDVLYILDQSTRLVDCVGKQLRIQKCVRTTSELFRSRGREPVDITLSS